MFEKFENRYIFKGCLTTKTALHIGIGGTLEPVGSDNPVIKDAFGRPYIPGSSFKGVLRSRIEALLRPMDTRENRTLACNPVVEKEWCITREKMNKLRQKVRNGEINDEKFTNILSKESCLTCQLFGSPWFASKVKIKDLYLHLQEDEEWIGEIEIRDGVAIDRDTETAGEGKKFDFETIPPATGFGVEIVVDNATPEELGLLFIGLKEFDQGVLPIGGNVSRGLGKVGIEWYEFEVVNGNLIEYLQKGEGKKLKDKSEIKSFIDSHIREFVNFIKTNKGGEKNVQKTTKSSNN
jgi:CRISPR-associated RAMP protein (TIGR02581 family)